jgi:hypothetical protein
MAKNASPSEMTDCLESHLRHLSLISAAAFADADALIIAPDAATAAVLADVITSLVSAHLFYHLCNYSINSYLSGIYEFIPSLIIV